MKIIHLISGGDVGGAKTHVHLLLQGLSKTDDVTLICFTDGPFAREAAALGIRTQVIDEGLAGTVSQLNAIISGRGFDLIHCHGARANMIGMLLKRKVGLPVVTTMHSDYRLDYMGRPLAALTYGNINKFALRRLDSWIGVSDATVDMMITRKFDPQHVYKLYNSVRFDNLTPKQTREEFLQTVGLNASSDSVIFGIAARISPVKDMETLIRAFSEVVKTVPTARLLIAGDGEQRAELEALAEKLCPAGSYCFCGWLDDVDSFYNAIDVNMLTSVSEGFPYALPEGARMHCATIASHVGGVPEFIEHEVNGLLFTPKDLATLSEYMCRLATSKELRETYAERLFERTRKEFSIDAMLDKQREIYRSVLAQHKRSLERKRDGIILCGAYGKGNSGDEAILSVIVSRLLEQDPVLPITVLSRKPSETRLTAHINAVYTFDFLRISRTMRKSMLYLSGGGSLIQDATSTRSLLYYLRSIRDAKKRGCKVMMFGCGIGPVQRPANRRRAVACISKYVDKITLRDAQSLDELHRLGVEDVPARVTADMALLSESAAEEKVSAYLSRSGLSSDTPYLLLAPRPWQGAEAHIADFAEAAVYCHRQYGLTPVLFAMEPNRDHSMTFPIAEQVKAQGVPVKLLDAPEDVSLCVGIVKHAAAVLSMRLHALIFAAGQNTPCAGVVYDPKVSGFMASLGNTRLCPLDDADAQKLCGLIDAMIHGEEPSADALRALAKENVEEAFSLMRAK